MIKVGTYGITADSHGYTVGKVTIYTDKKTGETNEILTSARYYGDLQGCIKYIRRQMHYDSIKTYDGDIAEAIGMLEMIDENFERLIAGVEKK